MLRGKSWLSWKGLKKGDFMVVRQEVVEGFVSVKLWTARVLRDFPELRSVRRRKDLIFKVWELSGVRFNPETITRSARWLQNTKGLYLPAVSEEDFKTKLEEKYKKAFGKKELGGDF